MYPGVTFLEIMWLFDFLLHVGSDVRDQTLLKVLHGVNNQNLGPVRWVEWFDLNLATFNPSVLDMLTLLEKPGTFGDFNIPSDKCSSPFKFLL